MSRATSTPATVSDLPTHHADCHSRPWPPVYLTVTEAARKLAMHRAAVLRLIHAGELRSLRLGRCYRIPEAEITPTRPGKPPHPATLAVSECARILRCSPTTIHGLLHHGHLEAEPDDNAGDYRITVTEFQRFLSQATR
jgi:excisionase family DNA binding protein